MILFLKRIYLVNQTDDHHNSLLGDLQTALLLSYQLQLSRILFISIKDLLDYSILLYLWKKPGKPDCLL